MDASVILSKLLKYPSMGIWRSSANTMQMTTQSVMAACRMRLSMYFAMGFLSFLLPCGLGGCSVSGTGHPPKPHGRAGNCTVTGAAAVWFWSTKQTYWAMALARSASQASKAALNSSMLMEVSYSFWYL